jgi:hypothetical protein
VKWINDFIDLPPPTLDPRGRNPGRWRVVQASINEQRNDARFDAPAVAVLTLQSIQQQGSTREGGAEPTSSPSTEQQGPVPAQSFNGGVWEIRGDGSDEFAAVSLRASDGTLLGECHARSR